MAAYAVYPLLPTKALISQPLKQTKKTRATQTQRAYSSEIEVKGKRGQEWANKSRKG